jgi:acyl-[acyl-carrier-protein] desaturase
MASSIIPDLETRIAPQREVLRGLSDQVCANLSYLAPIEKAWQPNDFLPDLTGEDWSDRLAKFRGPASELTDAILVVLVADMITEEALPSYSVSLNLMAENYTGTDPSPWAKWLRGWTSEENRHGDLLNAYLRLTGRVDMRAVEVTIHHLLNKGFDPQAFPDLYGGLIYTAFQERATRISHANVARLVQQQGERSLSRICQRIAGDEARHEAFYTTMMGHVFDQDPETAMTVCQQMMRRAISMPGRMMYDGRDPNLFDHFAAVAQRLGVYTVQDYISIIEHLVKTWNLAGRSVSGKAARAQDYLCMHAERCTNIAAHVADSATAMGAIKFSWIFDREV